MRGRYDKKRPKSEGMFVRLSREEIEQLEFIAAKTGKSKSDVIRDGIRIKYNLASYATNYDEEFD